MWEISLPLVLIDVFRASLLPTAIYTTAVYLGVIIFQPFLGKWCDDSNRLNSQFATVTSENIAVISTCFTFMLIVFFLEPTTVSPDASKSLHVNAAIVMVGAWLCALGVVGEVSVASSTQMLEKDWVVVISRNRNKEIKSINTLLRRIDLTSKALGTES